MSGTLTFNGTTAASLGIRIGGVTPYDAPGREVQTYTVPGRIGAVYPAKDLSQIPNEVREYSAGLYKRAATPETVERTMAQIRYWLLGLDGYAELTDSYEPQFYRRAFFTGDFAAIRKGAGQNFEFPLRFSCDPRRFIAGDHHFTVAGVSGSAVYTTPATVNGFQINEAAKPLIKVSNGGDEVTVTFTDVTEVGGVQRNAQIGQLVLANYDDDFWFDTESLTAYYDDGTPANSRIKDVIGEIWIGKGQTKISFNSSLVQLTIYPRWWVR